MIFRWKRQIQTKPSNMRIFLQGCTEARPKGANLETESFSGSVSTLWFESAWKLSWLFFGPCYTLPPSFMEIRAVVCWKTDKPTNQTENRTSLAKVLMWVSSCSIYYVSYFIFLIYVFYYFRIGKRCRSWIFFKLFFFFLYHSNLYLGLEYRWSFLYLQWCFGTKTIIFKNTSNNKMFQSKTTQWKQLQAEVKCFELMVLNCPGVVLEAQRLKADFPSSEEICGAWSMRKLVERYWWNPAVQSSIDVIQNGEHPIMNLTWKDTDIYHGSVPKWNSQFCYAECEGEGHTFTLRIKWIRLYKCDLHYIADFEVSYLSTNKVFA